MNRFRIDLDDGITRVTTTRPGRHGAFDGARTAGRTPALDEQEGEPPCHAGNSPATRTAPIQDRRGSRRAEEIAAERPGRAPGACREAERLAGSTAWAPIGAAMTDRTAKRIAGIRTRDAAEEDLAAFPARGVAAWTFGGAG